MLSDLEKRILQLLPQHDQKGYALWILIQVLKVSDHDGIKAILSLKRQGLAQEVYFMNLFTQTNDSAWEKTERSDELLAEMLAAEALAVEQEQARVLLSCKNPRCKRGADGRSKLLAGAQTLYCCGACRVSVHRSNRKAKRRVRKAKKCGRPRIHVDDAAQKTAWRRKQRASISAEDAAVLARYGGMQQAVAAYEGSMPDPANRVELAKTLWRLGGSKFVANLWYGIRGIEPPIPEPMKKKRHQKPNENFLRMMKMFGGYQWTPDQWQMMKAYKSIPLDQLESAEERDKRERKLAHEREGRGKYFIDTNSSLPMWKQAGFAGTSSDEDHTPKTLEPEEEPERDDDHDRGKKRVGWLR